MIAMLLLASCAPPATCEFPLEAWCHADMSGGEPDCTEFPTFDEIAGDPPTVGFRCTDGGLLVRENDNVFVHQYFFNGSTHELVAFRYGWDLSNQCHTTTTDYGVVPECEVECTFDPNDTVNPQCN